MKEFWDDRYSLPEYAYGKEPNVFFKSWVDKTDPGVMFLPGEGEGRNAVYAASKGWKVNAFDQSEIARNKAMQLADEKGVIIYYQVGSIMDIRIESTTVDMVGLVYFHLPPQVRIRYHEYLMSILKDGGILVLEGFSKAQINNASGGPKDIAMLYSLDDIMKDFDKLEVLHASSERINFDEGRFHQGEADVVRFVGKK